MKKIDPIPAVLFTVLACVGTGAATSRYWIGEVEHFKHFAEVGLEESKPLIAKYGLERNSRNLEELLIRHFFQDERDGIFLDVGANHYQAESNTYYLEKQLGWRGIAIEPLTEFQADYLTHRPRTQFIAAFASDVADSTVPFFLPPGNHLMASSNPDFAQKGSASPREEMSVPTTTINRVLEQARIDRLDFMSMDIELAEPQALQGFDVERYRPRLVCIEAHSDVRQFILDYFQQHGYRVIGNYLRVDTRNLYFTRIEKDALE
jgi:FkbM family methyltransferase